jgi:hypothetical protein
MSSEFEFLVAAYGPLSKAEDGLVQALEKGAGAVVDCETNDDDRSPMNYEKWNPDRRLRSNIIWSICHSEVTLRRIQLGGISITGAIIVGHLDLSLLTLTCPVEFRRCALPGGVAFSLSDLPFVSFEGCYLKNFYGLHMNVRGNVILNGGFSCGEKIVLTGATIGGDLDLSNGHFLASDGEAFVADHAEIGGSLKLCNGFTSNGAVRLVAAKITGDLDCGGAQLSCRSKVALRAERAEVGGAVLLNQALDAQGLVEIVGGRTGSDRFVERTLRMAQKAIGANTDDSDLAEHLKRFIANGEVDLDGITIGGNLDCSGAQFNNAGGRALSVAGGKIAGSVICAIGLRSPFEAIGEVHLQGVRVDYDLICIESFIFESIDRPNECHQQTGRDFTQKSLNAENAEIKGSIIIERAFFEGEFRLVRAQVGNDLRCNATFINPGKDAIDATAARVGGVVALGTRSSKGFMTDVTLSTVAGALRFVRSNIEGDLRIDVSFGRGSEGIIAQSAQIGGGLLLSISQHSDEAVVNLRDARLGSLILDEKLNWPKKGKLTIDGLIYNNIEWAGDVSIPLQWFALQQYPNSQPYKQLARALQEQGKDSDAKKVLIAKEDSWRTFGRMTAGEKVWTWLLRTVIGYGYKISRAFYLAGAVVVFGWAVILILMWLGGNGIMRPTKMESENYAPLNLPMYSLDVFLPVINLRQKDYWWPDANKRCDYEIAGHSDKWACGSFLRVYLWFQVLVGWVLTTLVVAGLTGLVRRD